MLPHCFEYFEITIPAWWLQPKENILLPSHVHTSLPNHQVLPLFQHILLPTNRSSPVRSMHDVPVSHIWALIVLLSTWILRVANSTPMVLLDSKLNSLRVKRPNRFVFPTPESPISTTKRMSKKIMMFRWWSAVSSDQLGTGLRSYLWIGSRIRRLWTLFQMMRYSFF